MQLPRSDCLPRRRSTTGDERAGSEKCSGDGGGGWRLKKKFYCRFASAPQMMNDLRGGPELINKNIMRATGRPRGLKTRPRRVKSRLGGVGAPAASRGYCLDSQPPPNSLMDLR